MVSDVLHKGHHPIRAPARTGERHPPKRGTRCETKVGSRQAVVRDRVLDLGDDLRDLLLTQCIGLRLQRSNLRVQCGKSLSALLGCHVPAFRVGANASEDRSVRVHAGD